MLLNILQSFDSALKMDGYGHEKKNTQLLIITNEICL